MYESMERNRDKYKKENKELKKTIERIKTSRQFERTNNINLTK